jgi:hypothetical protein
MQKTGSRSDHAHLVAIDNDAQGGLCAAFWPGLGLALNPKGALRAASPPPDGARAGCTSDRRIPELFNDGATWMQTLIKMSSRGAFRRYYGVRYPRAVA